MNNQKKIEYQTPEIIVDKFSSESIMVANLSGADESESRSKLLLKRQYFGWFDL